MSQEVFNNPLQLSEDMNTPITPNFPVPLQDEDDMKVIGILSFENVLECILNIKILDEGDREKAESKLQITTLTKTKSGRQLAFSKVDKQNLRSQFEKNIDEADSKAEDERYQFILSLTGKLGAETSRNSMKDTATQPLVNMSP